MTANAISPALLALIPIAAVIGIIGLSLRHKRPGQSSTAQADRGMEDDGVLSLPVVATFTGLRGLPPWIALMSNSLNPSLRLRSDGVEYRVLRRGYAPFSQIQSVEVRKAFATTNLQFTFRDAALTLTANLADPTAAQDALRRLPRHISRGRNAARLERR